MPNHMKRKLRLDSDRKVFRQLAIGADVGLEGADSEFDSGCLD